MIAGGFEWVNETFSQTIKCVYGDVAAILEVFDACTFVKGRRIVFTVCMAAWCRGGPGECVNGNMSEMESEPLTAETLRDTMNALVKKEAEDPFQFHEFWIEPGKTVVPGTVGNFGRRTLTETCAVCKLYGGAGCAKQSVGIGSFIDAVSHWTKYGCDEIEKRPEWRGIAESIAAGGRL